MPSRGLLGALAGLGQGLTKMGENIERRREQALAWAREEAQRQEARVQRQSERQEDRDYRTASTLFTAGEQAIRQRDQQKFQYTQREEQREFQAESREDQQAHAEHMARLSSRLARSNSEASARMQEELDRGDIVGTRDSVVARNADGSQVVDIYGRNRAGQWRRIGRIRELPRSTSSANDDSSGSPAL